MAYLNKRQYEYRAMAAAERNYKSSLEAIENGMTEKQADLITTLCSLRHAFHCDMDKITLSDGQGRKAELHSHVEAINKSGLPTLSLPYDNDEFIDIDDMDELISYNFNEDQPNRYDEKGIETQEWKNWYDDNYNRIFSQLDEVHKSIENYLGSIDDKYGSSFCPSGALRLF